MGVHGVLAEVIKYVVVALWLIREGTAMGFKPEQTIYKLTFKGTALDGLEVRVGSLTIREYNAMLRAGSADGPAGVLKANVSVFELFLSKLISWNLEDADGNPVPQDMAGLESQERPVVTGIINAWQMAMVNIDGPLKSDSSSGNGLLEESLELGNLSESPQN